MFCLLIVATKMGTDINHGKMSFSFDSYAHFTSSSQGSVFVCLPLIIKRFSLMLSNVQIVVTQENTQTKKKKINL